MHRRHAAIWATVAVVGVAVACDSFRNGPASDAAIPAPTCMELHDRFMELVSGLDRTCTTDMDCVNVGGGNGSAAHDCDCGIFISGDCFGVSMNTSAYATVADEVQALEGQCLSLCGEQCVVDCLAQPPRCLGNGMCGYRFETSCFGFPVDAAGLDAN